MITKLTRSVLLVVAVFGLASFAKATNRLIIVPSPGLPSEVVDALCVKLGEHLLHKAESGTVVSIVDPITQAEPVQLVVPAGSARARSLNKGFRAKLDLMKDVFARLPGQSRASDVAWQRGAVRLFETLRMIHSKIAKPGDVITVFALGDPRYRSGEAAYAFDGAVPRDSWLYASAANPRFAIARPDTLQNWRIFFSPVPHDWAGNLDDFARAVERFYTAFVQLQGGRFQLADQTFVWPQLALGEVAEAAIGPLAPASEPLGYFTPGSAVREIVRTVENSPKVTVAPQAPATVEVTPSAPVAPTPPAASASTVVRQDVELPVQATPQLPVGMPVMIQQIPRVAAGEMGLGLIWGNSNGEPMPGDLDIYLSVKGVRGELWYKAMQLTQGSTLVASLKKDILAAQGLNAPGDPRLVYEFVTIHQAVVPEDVTLYVNVFQNRGSAPIKALLLVEFDQRRWTQLIEIPATTGDGGISADRTSSPNWLRIDLAALLKRPALGAAQ